MLETMNGPSQAEFLKRQDVEFLRRQDAARILSMSPRQFDQLVREKKLPSPVRLDRIPRWSRSRLLAHIEDLAGTPTG